MVERIRLTLGLVVIVGLILFHTKPWTWKLNVTDLISPPAIVQIT